MKKLLIILFAVSISACSSDLSKNEFKIVSFDTSIHCDACVNTVFDNLPKETGVVDLKVDLESKTVTVVFNPDKTSVEKLAEKINELGYSAYVKSFENFIEK
ncbi:MAG: heavy metal-associated domain-containing protein [bacterium]